MDALIQKDPLQGPELDLRRGEVLLDVLEVVGRDERGLVVADQLQQDQRRGVDHLPDVEPRLDRMARRDLQVLTRRAHLGLLEDHRLPQVGIERLLAGEAELRVVVIGPLLDARVEAVEHRRLNQAGVEELQAVRLQALETRDLVRPRPILTRLGLELLLAALEVLDHLVEAGVVGRDARHGRVDRPDELLGHVECGVGGGARERDQGRRRERVVPRRDLHERPGLERRGADRDVLGEPELASHEFRGDVLGVHDALEDPPDGPVAGRALQREDSLGAPPPRRVHRSRGGAAR
jgi:hypothetical protein